jgi:hypothetical protein
MRQQGWEGGLSFSSGIMGGLTMPIYSWLGGEEWGHACTRGESWPGIQAPSTHHGRGILCFDWANYVGDERNWWYWEGDYTTAILLLLVLLHHYYYYYYYYITTTLLLILLLLLLCCYYYYCYEYFYYCCYCCHTLSSSSIIWLLCTASAAIALLPTAK